MTSLSVLSILDIRIEESWSSLVLILLVLIELSLPWGTVPSASASIEEPWRACASVPSPTHQPFCLIKKRKRKEKKRIRIPLLCCRLRSPTRWSLFEKTIIDRFRRIRKSCPKSRLSWREALKSAIMTSPVVSF